MPKFEIEDVFPLVPLQEGLFFHWLLGGGGVDPYVVQVVLRLEGGVDGGLLRESVGVVWGRHVGLRLGFRVGSGGVGVGVVVGWGGCAVA